MKWVEKDVPSVLSSAKAERALTIVVIYDETEASTKLFNSLQLESVESTLESVHHYPFKFQFQSQEAKQFAEIYPLLLLPIIYIIGDGGFPLEILSSSVGSEEFITKFSNAVQQHQSAIKNDTQSPASFPNNSHLNSGHTDSPSDSERISSVSSSPEAKSPELSGSLTDEQTTPSCSSSDKVDSTESQKKPELQSRIDSAMSLIEARRKERATKEAEEARKKERDRIEMGRGITKLKQKQAETQARELREQLRKDKVEEKAARQRIRQQIAQDRAERQTKYYEEKNEQQKVKQAREEARDAQQLKQKAEADEKRRETARIQFRLPDGSTLTESFPSNQNLESVFSFVSQKFPSYEPFELYTLYPRELLSDSQLQQSLLELQLSPSSVIIVSPKSSSRQNNAFSSKTSNTSGLFTFLLSPIFALWAFLINLFSAKPAHVKDKPTQNDSRSTSTSSGARPKTNRGTEKSRTRRLHDLSDDNDDNATWNGNSTQQM